MRRGAAKATLDAVKRARVFIAVACALLISSALAAIGEAPEALLADLAEHEPTRLERGRFSAGEEFVFELELRGGLVYELNGEGILNESNIAFMADLVAAGTGYGDSISQPIAAFLATRVSDLAGQGRSIVGVEEYQLALEVSGSSRPHAVRFSLALREVPSELFLPTSHVIGPPDARYVVREYSDFQCPFCANYSSQALPLIKELLMERGDVRFEYHHFPLESIHANAMPAAEASECVTEANSQKDFWTFHDALFERQRAWQGLADPQLYFVRLASQLGLETAGVTECLEEGRFRQLVRDSYLSAAGPLRLTGTPSVFLNGYQVQDFLDPQAYLELIELVDAFALEE